MKIVYCIPGIYNSGGMERVLTNKVNWLVSHGYDITILTTEQKKRPPFFDLDSRVSLINLDINWEEYFSAPFLYKIFLFYFKRWLHKKRLKKYLYKIESDFVISMFFHEMSHLPNIKDGSVKILEFHFAKKHLQKRRRNKLFSWIDNLNFKNIVGITQKYEKFVVLTEADKRAWGGRNIIVIPNSSTFHLPQRATLKHKKAIAVGRCVYEKGFERLITIWESFSAIYKDWHLEIVGDGVLKSHLEELINEKGLHESVLITPAVKNIYEKYQSASILLMTSFFEGLPMVLIEAQSCGVPVISYDVPNGPAEIINDGMDGFLIEDGNECEFVKKLSYLAENEQMRILMGENAFINSKRFSEDSIMTKWDCLFKSLKM